MQIADKKIPLLIRPLDKTHGYYVPWLAGYDAIFNCNIDSIKYVAENIDYNQDAPNTSFRSCKSFIRLIDDCEEIHLSGYCGKRYGYIDCVDSKEYIEKVIAQKRIEIEQIEIENEANKQASIYKKIKEILYANS
jgi:proteasome assembly chaperone (PAC2) family protein